METSDERPNIVLVGYAVPKDDLDEVTKHDAYPQIQGTKLMWRIICGVEECGSLAMDLIGSVPASDYPRNPRFVFGFRRWAHKSGASDVVMPFVNVIFLKHLTRLLSTFALLCKWLVKNRKAKNRHILIYAMHSPYVLAAALAKLLFQTKITVVVLDLPAFMNAGLKVSVIRRIAKIVDALIMGVAMRSMDGLIVLTEHAGRAIGPAATPKLVVEGAVSLDEVPSLPRLKDVRERKKVVMFTGALVGLDILLNAFKLIEDPDTYLYLSGRGPMEQEIIEAARCDRRIAYFGFLSSEALLERMSEATVFVNVRSAKTPFIEYSFPSKLLEYMATGRPTISTRLPSIPDEYHEYLYLLREETPEHLARLIIEVCNKASVELDDFGCRARDFVRTQKNYLRQGERIYQFIRSL